MGFPYAAPSQALSKLCVTPTLSTIYPMVQDIIVHYSEQHKSYFKAAKDHPKEDHTHTHTHTLSTVGKKSLNKHKKILNDNLLMLFS